MCVAEASYTLLLYDELLEWTERPLREFLTYPMQSEWQRKECLHLTIIHNFDRGKVSPSLILRCTSPTIKSFMWLIMLIVEGSGQLNKKLFTLQIFAVTVWLEILYFQSQLDDDQLLWPLATQYICVQNKSCSFLPTYCHLVAETYSCNYSPLW